MVTSTEFRSRYLTASSGEVKLSASQSISSVNSVRILVRIMGSSSTRTIAGLRFSDTLQGSFSLLFEWNPDMERGSTAALAFKIDGARMVYGHDPMYDRQPQARADSDR